MNNKVQYAMPVDDDDEIEDGDEMVDMEEDYEDAVDNQDDNQDEDEDEEEYDTSEKKEGGHQEHYDFANQNVADNMEADEDQEEDDEAEEEDSPATRAAQMQLQQQMHHNAGNPNMPVVDGITVGGAYNQPAQQQIPNNQMLGGDVNMAAARMRPQSAKASTHSEQLRFQQMQQLQAQQNNQGWTQNQQQNLQLQQQQLGQIGYSQQNLGSYGGQPLGGGLSAFQQQANLYYPTIGNKTAKRRPGTASRRNQMQFGKKSGLPPSAAAAVPVSAKASNHIDNEISKLRPRVVHQERERLYDDVMKQRMTTNYFKDENTKLRTRLLMIEAELGRKDKVIDDLLSQQEQNAVYGGTVSTKFNQMRAGQMKNESHLIINLKRKVRDMQSETNQKQAEVEALKRNIRSSRLQEMEIEVQLYMEECARLRHQLEEVIKSKDTFADPEELKIIEQKFQQRDMVIAQMQNENQEIAQALQKKDDENRQLAELIQDMERRMKKAQASNKKNLIYKREAKDQARELNRARREVIDEKKQNANLNSLISDMKDQLAAVERRQANPRNNLYGSSQSNHNQQQNAQQATEIRTLSAQIQQHQNKAKKQEKLIGELQDELTKKNDEISIEIHDKLRFKKFSEDYMQQIARLEAQLDACDIKPKSKMSQRPKDTVAREGSHSHSNIHATKSKRVDVKQLSDVLQLIKMKLQQQSLKADQMEKLFFEPYSSEQEVTLIALKERLDVLGVSSKKSLLLARFLFEPQESTEVIYNENAKATQFEILETLREAVGPYKLFTVEDEEDDTDFALEKALQQVVVERFGRYRNTLVEALECEDFEYKGVLDLTQLREAISSVDEDLNEDLMDYLLYYVFIRSESVEKMQYKNILEMLDSAVQAHTRTTSATKKNRPESSSPDKIKQRNPKDAAKEESEDNYSDEMIENEDENEEADDDYMKEFEKLKKQSAEVEAAAQRAAVRESAENSENYEEEFDETPRQKVGGKPGVVGGIKEESQLSGDKASPAGEDPEEDEEEMIDVAESIFIRMAEEMTKQQMTIRELFLDYIYEVDIESEFYEILEPQSLLEGLRKLGIDDMTQKETTYLLKVLSKPELNGNIMMKELLTIMSNFGLGDQYEGMSSPELQESPDLGARTGGKVDETDPESSPDQNTSSTKKKKKEKLMDLSKLDQKSVKIMVMLMLFLLENNLTTQDFFEDVIYQQKVTQKTKEQVIDIMKSADFFKVLAAKGIRKKDTEHVNLREFLQLRPAYPDLIVLKNIKRTLEQMADNEQFMDAIREDVLIGDEQAQAEAEEEAYQRELEAIQRGEYSPTALEGGEMSGDHTQQKLDTVGEEMTTGSKNQLLQQVPHNQPQKLHDQYSDREQEYAEQNDDDYEF